MIACPWCDEDATDLFASDEVPYQCPSCGTCVDLREEPAILESAA